jgi:vancomycin resistance protein VanW
MSLPLRKVSNFKNLPPENCGKLQIIPLCQKDRIESWLFMSKRHVEILILSAAVLLMTACFGAAAPGVTAPAVSAEGASASEMIASPAKPPMNEPSAEPKIESLAEEKSGPLNVLPWENDAEFIRQKDAAGTPVLMGAYRAVLHDPLPGEEFNVHLAASLLAGKIVQPGQTFSQNGSIGPYTQDRGFRIGPTYIGSTLTKTIGGGVCKISSTLYNVVVLSDMTVVERHCHSMPVPYVPYGQDATVSYGNRDFKFRNNLDFPVLIWAQGIDNKLYMAVYGRKESPKVEWKHDITGVKDAGKAYRSNPELAAGEEKLVLEGMDGATVKSVVTVTYADGTVTEKNMGVSFYMPMPNVYEKGPG